MEVEKNAGRLNGVDEKPKAKWAILFAVLGILIVVLIIVITTVLINRNNGGSNSQGTTGSSDSEYNEAAEAYFTDNEEIAGVIVDQGLDGEGILKLLKEKIDTAENEKTKAMLEQDYYMTMFSVYGADESKKDEIINGLIRVDEILKTTESAENVANIALAYYDFDTYEKYVDIIKEKDPDYKSIFEMIEEESE